MRRKKQLTACLLSFALLLGMIPASEVSAAKKVSLSTKKLTVTKGKSKTLKVKNTTKKVKWKILSGKKYISLKKKGKVAVSVKGEKKGTAKVQATVGKKKLTCKVTVKNVKTSKTTTPSGTSTPSATTPATPVTTTPSGTSTPSATPLANSTNAPENDAEALKNLIAEQKKQGASSKLSEDIQNSKQYTWENGRLVGIDWGEVELKGELSTEKFSALTSLRCGGNQLTSLDVTKNTALTTLDCNGNQLSSLDVTKNTALTELLCGTNQLSSLDVTKNTTLTSLGCGGNQLSSLDVTKNTALTDLRCNDNQLRSLDVTKNTELLDNNIICDANVTIIRNNN